MKTSTAFLASILLLLVVVAMSVVDSQDGAHRHLQSGISWFQQIISFLAFLPQLFLALFWPTCWKNFYRETDYGDQLIRNEDYVRFSFQAADAITEMRILYEGPKTLKGLFWMDISQTSMAELFSFAATPEGGSLSTGVVSDSESYNVRGPGDRVRAQTFNMTSNTYGDSVFEFHIIEGTAAAPEKFRIIPSLQWFGTCWRYRAKSCYRRVLDFTMELMNTPSSTPDGRSPHERYDNSVVWRRTSTGILLYDYEVIQIVDGNGDKLQPAYDDFVARVMLANEGWMYANEIGQTTQPPKCTS